MIRVKCPCCGNYTQLVNSVTEPIFDICELCFWQYDVIAHNYPNKEIGSNYISLNEAIKNYRHFGVIKTKFKDMVRAPFDEELPENN